MPGTFESQYAESIKLLHVSYMTFSTSFILLLSAISHEMSQWSLEIAMFNAIIIYCSILHTNRAPFIAELFALLLNSHYLHNNTITELFISGLVILLISGVSLIILCIANCVQKRRNPAGNAYHGWFDFGTQLVILQVLIVVFGNGYMIFFQWNFSQENLALSIMGFVLIILPLFICYCFYIILAVMMVRERRMNTARIQSEPSA